MQSIFLHPAVTYNESDSLNIQDPLETNILVEI